MNHFASQDYFIFEVENLNKFLNLIGFQLHSQMHTNIDLVTNQIGTFHL